MSKQYTKFHIGAFALAMGMLWGIAVFIAGILSWLTGFGDHFVKTVGSLYIGYDQTWWGAVAGFCWAFLDGLVAGALFAWMYNALVVKFTHEYQDEA